MRCAVPFCEHGAIGPDNAGWICADHYRLVDKLLKKLFNRALDAGNDALAQRHFDRMVVQATERGAGIA